MPRQRHPSDQRQAIRRASTPPDGCLGAAIPPDPPVDRSGRARPGGRAPIGSELHADEGTHSDALEALYHAHRFNHSEAFSWNGACTNQAESYFSPLRRAVTGQHHHVSKQYLHQYANEAAWREDDARTANGTQYVTVLASALYPVSRAWKGYWQREIA